MKESDWLLEHFDQSESGSKSYHGKQNQGHVREHRKLYQKVVSKVTLHFVWGHLLRKQTVMQCQHAVKKTASVNSSMPMNS